MKRSSGKAIGQLIHFALCAAIAFAAAPCLAQEQNSPPASAPATPSPAPKSLPTSEPPEAASRKAEDPDAALDRAVRDAGNDRAALVRKLQQYLERFPEAPRKAAVYRALVESCEQLNDSTCALQNAELLIANRPDDSEMMLVAVNLLDKRGDDESLARAGGYLTRVIDRVEKTPSSDKPARISEQDWQTQQNDVRLALYILRGKIEEKEKKTDEATKDFIASYAIRPNALAAQHLAQLAELRKDFSNAIEYYLDAFVLPENGPGGAADRHLIRENLGNVWREVHGNDAGLGDAILGAYDHTQPPPAAPRPHDRNRDARDALSFTLRQLDGSLLPLSLDRGKVVVLSFWATWCGPCRELEPLFANVAAGYAGRNDVVFLAVNTDEDEARVRPFLDEQKWKLPVAFADGLDEFLRVLSLPTVIVLDHTGKISYRINGYQSEEFEERLSNAIERAFPPITRHSP
jgi:thiol-disulfide isomerase/thioredoxin/tetratricopeptide (TPR) repeat protein